MMVIVPTCTHVGTFTSVSFETKLAGCSIYDVLGMCNFHQMAYVSCHSYCGHEPQNTKIKATVKIYVKTLTDISIIYNFKEHNIKWGKINVLTFFGPVARDSYPGNLK